LTIWNFAGLTQPRPVALVARGEQINLECQPTAARDAFEQVAPPVIDLAAEGFTLVGGRLDYIDARPVATLVYKRRAHIVNVFIAQAPGSDREGKIEPQVQGFNMRCATIVFNRRTARTTVA
jgi:anti-sigma factor RsiW